jgi:hypothetical protein
MPDEISGMGKTYRNTSMILKIVLGVVGECTIITFTPLNAKFISLS